MNLAVPRLRASPHSLQANLLWWPEPAVAQLAVRFRQVFSFLLHWRAAVFTLLVAGKQLGHPQLRRLRVVYLRPVVARTEESRIPYPGEPPRRVQGGVSPASVLYLDCSGSAPARYHETRGRHAAGALLQGFAPVSLQTLVTGERADGVCPRGELFTHEGVRKSHETQPDRPNGR